MLLKIVVVTPPDPLIPQKRYNLAANPNEKYSFIFFNYPLQVVKGMLNM